MVIAKKKCIDKTYKEMKKQMHIVQLKETNLKVGYNSHGPKFFMTFWRRQSCGNKEKIRLSGDKKSILGDGLIGKAFASKAWKSEFKPQNPCKNEPGWWQEFLISALWRQKQDTSEKGVVMRLYAQYSEAETETT